jgi:hypothetical protein
MLDPIRQRIPLGDDLFLGQPVVTPEGGQQVPDLLVEAI